VDVKAPEANAPRPPDEETSGGIRAVAGVSVFVVLAATLATLAIGAVMKEPCAAGSWGDGRQYKRLCYSDIVPLLYSEHLTPQYHDRLPYLEPCGPSSGQCDEYPPLTMYAMRLAAWAKDTNPGFFWWNVGLLAACALFTAWALHAISGERAWFFALAPTLLIYAFVNWDLLAVAFATGATLAYLRRRDGLSGVLLGLGAAAKLYPGLILVPFAAGRLRERHGAARTEAREARRGLERLIGGAILAYAAVNLPLALAAPRSWGTFFRFNASRPVDWDSLWFVACTRLQGSQSCSWPANPINALSLALFVVLGVTMWWIKRRRSPGFDRWTLAFPLLVLFLLTNKVYSPQYGLWLLPWFALALPSPWLFAAFEATDVAVFLTRFTFFGRLAAESGDPIFGGYHGATFDMFQAALLARAIVLVICVTAWVLKDEPDYEDSAPRVGAAAPSPAPSTVPT
jgi:uncharacterized membrane protein